MSNIKKNSLKKNTGVFMLVIIISLSLFITSCSKSANNKVTADILKAEISGKLIWLQGDSFFGGRTVTPSSNDITIHEITKQLTDEKNGTDEVYANISINTTDGVWSGPIKVLYKKYEQGWQFTRVDRATSEGFKLKTK